MKSIIVSVGTELLFGQTVNTNAAYLSEKLNTLGIDVMYHYTVGDNPNRMRDTIERALAESDLIITTGGLGPTQDDITKEIVCEIMGDELVIHNESLERIETMFSKMNRIMTENNIKQAYLPSTAKVFANDGGTAPGFALEKNGKIAICLPGPPREMKGMFEGKATPYLLEKTSSVIYSKMLRVFGLGESALESELEDLISAQIDPTLATYAKEAEVALRVTSKRSTEEEAKKAVEDMVEKVSERISENIYSYDDEDLVDVVGRKLMERNISISCAESCTGGMFASTIMGVAGISAVFDRGIVTYSYKAKEDELGVKRETLETFGAVSSEAAVEMTKGLKEKSGSRLCISITGVAGPGGGSEEKPVGLVYICAMLDDEMVCNEYKMRVVSRNWNRNYSVMLMLNVINKLLDKRQ